jgi:hypothetical protein
MALALFALFVLGLTACPALGSDSRSLTLSLSLGGVDGSYVITLTPTSGAPITQTVTSATCTFTALAAITYTISVSAYHSTTGTGTVIAQGSGGTVDLSTQASATVPVSLAYIVSGSGTGGISINFSFPAITSLTWTLIDPAGASSSQTQSLGSATSFTYSKPSATVGAYQLYVSFNASGTVALVSETVVVLQGITTTATITVNPSDFKDKAVTGLSIPTGMTSFNMCPGQTLNIASSSYLTLSPSDAPYSHVAWTTNNSTVATVSAGTVTAGTALGSPTITATSVDDSSQHVSYNINVFSAFTTSSVTGTYQNYGNASCLFQITCTTPALTVPITGVSYSQDNTNWYTMTKSSNTYTAATTLSGADGAKTIYLKATDGTHYWTSTLSAYLDTAVPSVGVTSNAVGSGEKVSPSSGTSSNYVYVSGSSVSTTFSLSDGLSGLKNYSLDGASAIVILASSLNLPLALGAHTLTVTDNVGNVASLNVTVAHDTAAPTITVGTNDPADTHQNVYPATSLSSGKIYTNGDSAINSTIEFSDNSPIASYIFSGTTYPSSATSILLSLSPGFTYDITATDYFGNTSAPTSITMVKDVTPPSGFSLAITDTDGRPSAWDGTGTCSLSFSSSVHYTYSTSASDSGSGVGSYQYAVASEGYATYYVGSPPSSTHDETYKFRVIDNVGNIYDVPGTLVQTSDGT